MINCVFIKGAPDNVKEQNSIISVDCPLGKDVVCVPDTVGDINNEPFTVPLGITNVSVSVIFPSVITIVVPFGAAFCISHLTENISLFFTMASLLVLILMPSPIMLIVFTFGSLHFTCIILFVPTPISVVISSYKCSYEKNSNVCDSV